MRDTRKEQYDRTGGPERKPLKNTAGKRTKSPRGSLVVNEEFFRNAPRDGEIEIRVKNPPEGFDYEAYQNRLDRTAVFQEKKKQEAPEREKRGSISSNQPKTTNSPGKKVLQGERPDPKSSRHEFLRGEEAREALYNIPPEKGESYSQKERVRSPQRPESEAYEEEEEEKYERTRGRGRTPQGSPPKSNFSSGKKKRVRLNLTFSANFD